MAIPREDLPRFAVEAVCGGKRKEEIIIDLTDAGVTQQAAQRIVDEMRRIHQELRPEGADGLEEKVLQAWLRKGVIKERYRGTYLPPRVRCAVARHRVSCAAG